MLCFGKQQRFQCRYVRFAVGNGDGLPAVPVASGGVDEYPVHGRHLLQMADAVCIFYSDMRQSQLREIVCGNLAKLLLTLHIRCLLEFAGKKGAVDAEASGQVR